MESCYWEREQSLSTYQVVLDDFSMLTCGFLVLSERLDLTICLVLVCQLTEKTLHCPEFLSDATKVNDLPGVPLVDRSDGTQIHRRCDLDVDF